MVTGFFNEAIMLYIANTGDMRYTEPRSLRFRVDDNAVYDHDIYSIDSALVPQWSDNSYCLFPCEANWTYISCNLQEMTGQVIYDRVFGKKHTEKFLPRFRESLLADFANNSGSLILMSSAMTGFTLSGAFGSMFNFASSFTCRGYLDDIAKNMWAIFKHEVIKFDENTGEIELIGLLPSDKMDPGNYENSEMAIHPYIAYVAGEYGDEKHRLASLKLLEERIGLEHKVTGVRRLKPGSFSLNMARVRAELLIFEDWKNLTQKNRVLITISVGTLKDSTCRSILNEVPYPGVLAAKARSHTSRDLDVALYPSAAPATVTLGVERLQPFKMYTYGNDKVVADSEGKGKINVFVDGRTEVILELA